MRPIRQPAGVQQPEIADDGSIKPWLDALASGACDEVTFLRQMQARFASDADGNWEVLSQLDQYYRRGKIKPELFHTVKKALAESALGRRNIAASREIPKVPEIPRVPQIPVARDVAILSDAHPQREETPPPDEAGELKPGSVLRRRYRIENVLGRGATGTVFQALDEYRLETPPDGRKLAIKVLHTAVTNHVELLAQLRREFQQQQLLSHPNIVRVFELDRDGPVVFFTMELLNGPLLSRVLHARKLIPLDRDQALAILRDIGAAVVYAHSRGVVHGSINPQNIFITIPGEVRVMDFAATHRSNHRSATPDHEVTMPFATSGYASCQVLEGELADARDDVFALACIAYLLLSGEHPFSKKTAIEARQANLSPQRPPNVTNRQWQALRAGLRWKREDRPANAEEWLERFDLRGAAKRLASITDLLEPPHRKQSKSSFTMAAVVGVILFLAGAFWIISKRNTLPQLDSNPPSRYSDAPSPIPAAPSGPATSADSAPIARSPPPPASDAPAVATTSRAASAPPPPVARAAPSVAASTAATESVPTPSVSASAAAAGPSKIEMVTDAVNVPGAESSAQVSVRRKGNLRGETTFTWWTESGTAKPRIDFSPVMPQLATIGDGKSGISLNILLSRAPRTHSKSFYVVIDQSQGGAALGARTLTMVTLLPSN